MWQNDQTSIIDTAKLSLFFNFYFISEYIMIYNIVLVSGV